MQSARILRVGGSAAENGTLEVLLRGAGHSQVAVTGIAEALEAIASRNVDLVLLDLIQPSNDVFNVLRAAQPANGKTSRVPVIVTAPATANDRVQACLQRGAEDYIATPFDASQRADSHATHRVVPSTQEFARVYDPLARRKARRYGR